MKQFKTEKRKVFDTDYVKVFLLDEKKISEVAAAISKLDCVKNVNLTKIKDYNSKETLTVYPKPMVDIESLEKRVVSFLDNYFDEVTEKS